MNHERPGNSPDPVAGRLPGEKRRRSPMRSQLHLYEDPVTFPDYPVEQRLAPKLWRFERPYSYYWREASGRYRRIVVPIGFMYDGASVPRRAESFVQARLLHKASGIHDWFYHWQGDLPYLSQQVYDVEAMAWRPIQTDPWPRVEADRLFYAVLADDLGEKPSLAARKAAYYFVRTAGWLPWRRNAEGDRWPNQTLYPH